MMKAVRRSPVHAWRRGPRRGTALYLLTLSISLLLTATGVTLVAVQRADRRLQQNIARTGELNWYARAGIEMAVACTEQVSDWRSRIVSNALFTDFPVGEGTVTVQVFDDADGLVANDATQPVRLRAIARRGGDVYRLEARLRPRAHPALKYALFGASAQDMEFKDHAGFRGPIRSHGKIKAAAGNTMAGDASFETMTGFAIEDPLTPKRYVSEAIPAPQPDLAFYTAMATPISGDDGTRCDLKGYNLSPTSNPGAAPNENGIYWLRAGGREVLIEDLHVKGTFIITETGGHKITFQKSCWLEPGPREYPVLLIDNPGKEVIFHLDTSRLESLITMDPFILLVGLGGVDMNENGLKLDTILSQIRGLVWINASFVDMENQTWPFIGCLVSDRIIVDHYVTVDNDPTLLETVSPGFVASGMSLMPGSVREVGP